MPSGFQQDPNQLSPGFYRITIDMSTYPTADANTNGAVTPNSGDSFATLPSSLTASKQRARGNQRFRNIINQLSGLADVQIIDVEITEASADSQATSLVFTARFDRDAGILGATQQKLGSPYLGLDGVTTVNTTELALKDQISRAIAATTSASQRVQDGSVNEEYQLQITVNSPIAAASVWASVTVALIDGTELITKV